MWLPLILLYHRIGLDEINSQLLAVSPDNFESHLAILSEKRNVLPMYKLIGQFRKGTFPTDSIAITFDDGYLDNLTNALPLLEKYRVHATVFVTSGMIDSDREFWWDALERVFFGLPNLPDSLHIAEDAKQGKWDLTSPDGRLKAYEDVSLILRNKKPAVIDSFLKDLFSWANVNAAARPTHRILSSPQLKELAKSPFIEIGSHTMSHPKLSMLTLEEQKREIVESKREIEAVINKPVRYISYPFGARGDVAPETVRIAKEAGYEAAIANIQGDANSNELYMLPRRLVRDWPRDMFSRWLNCTDKSALEKETISARSQRLKFVIAHSFETERRDRPLSCREKRTLSIVHINTHDKAGGAAKVAWRLSKLQRSKGHRSGMMVGYKTTRSNHSMSFALQFDNEVQALCRREGQLFYEYQGSHQLVNHPAINCADILHLHNLHGWYFNPFSLPAISREKPVIWTLHDMQAITGHCAHSFDCDKWKTGCFGCPYLGTEVALSIDTSAQLLRDKKQIYDHSCLQIVAPSEWLKNKVEKSVLKNHPVELVYNGIDTRTFRAYEKSEARRRLGIPDECFAVGAVAHTGAFHNPWKGARFMQAALESLWQKRKDVLFVNIGAPKPARNSRIICIPHIDDEADLAQAYSALDLFLYTPVADNCPLVLLEALSCGLPVVSFATGGVPELVLNGKNGFLVKTGDVASLVRATEALLYNPQLREQFAAGARDWAVRKFDQDSMYRNYLRLYEKCICEHPKRRQNIKPIPLKRIPRVVRTPSFIKMRSCVFNIMQRDESEEGIGLQGKVRKELCAKNEGDNLLRFKEQSCEGIKTKNQGIMFPGNSGGEKILKAKKSFMDKENEISWQNQEDQVGGNMMKDAHTKQKRHFTGETKISEDAYEEVRRLIDDGKKKEAIGALRMLLTMYPDYALAHNDLGVLYYQQGEKEKALEHYEQAAQLEPEHLTFQKNLADFYCVESGDPEGALKIYLKVLEADPADIETLLAIGDICASLGKNDDARVFYNRILELEPWNLNAQAKLEGIQGSDVGGQRTENGRLTAADTPGAGKTAEDLYVEAQELVEKGREREAIQKLEGLIERYPDYALAHNDLGVLYFKSGEKQKARRQYEEAGRLAPENATFQKNLADFYCLEMGELEEALKIYLRVLEDNPTDIETLVTLGDICVSLHKSKDARVFYERVLELEPWNMDAMRKLDSIE